MYLYLYRWCGILVIPGFFTTICTTNPFCTEYSCTDRVWVDWKSGGGKQVHKARARRERNRDKLSHFSKKPLPSVVGKVAARQEPRVPIPCERTFGVSRK